MIDGIAQRLRSALRDGPDGQRLSLRELLRLHGDAVIIAVAQHLRHLPGAAGKHQRHHADVALPMHAVIMRVFLKQRGIVIYMEVSLETQLNRLRRDKRRPMLQGENPQEVLIRLWEEREPIYEDVADFTVITDKRSVGDVCGDIANWLRNSNSR